MDEAGERIRALQLAPLMPEFMSRHPALRFELHFRDNFVDLVADWFDAAIRIGAVDTGGDLIARRLAPNRRVICAARSYLATHGTPRHPSELKLHRILHFAPSLSGTIWRLEGPKGVTETVVDPVLSADNIEALRHAAIAGAGLTILATFVAGADLALGRLVPVFSDFHPTESTVSIVYHNAPHLRRKVRAIVNFLAEHFAGTPPLGSGARENDPARRHGALAEGLFEDRLRKAAVQQTARPAYSPYLPSAASQFVDTRRGAFVVAQTIGGASPNRATRSARV